MGPICCSFALKQFLNAVKPPRPNVRTDARVNGTDLLLEDRMSRMDARVNWTDLLLFCVETVFNGVKSNVTSKT
jgi:hypothetical protein